PVARAGREVRETRRVDVDQPEAAGAADERVAHHVDGEVVAAGDLADGVQAEGVALQPPRTRHLERAHVVEVQHAADAVPAGDEGPPAIADERRRVTHY